MHMKKGKLKKEFQLPNIANIPIKDKKIISPIKITAANKNPIINNINISNNNINIKKNIQIISISSEKNKNQKNLNPINEKKKSSTTQKFIKIQNKIPNGLTNEGKPLFMNAILQCFANIKKINPDYMFFQFDRIYSSMLIM